MAIPLTCSSCDYEFKVKDELAGRRIKCPKCKEVMTVPAEEDEAEPEEEERPKKKKKKKKAKNNKLLIGSAIGGAALIVVVVLFIVFSSGRGNADVAQKKREPVPVKPVNQEPEVEEPQIVKKGPASAVARLREGTEVKNILRQIATAYRNYEVSENRGPKNQKDLSPYYEKSRLIDDYITNKWITVIWGVNSRSGYPNGTSNTILAYETDPDQQGIRYVVRGDLSVDGLTDAEFNAAPKAQGK